MRVLLLNLPWRENGRLGVRAGSRWPFTSEPEKDGHIHYIPFPFFLAYATALLKKNGHEAKLIDAIAEGVPEQRLFERIDSFHPELILAEISTPSFNNDMRILQAIHQNFSHAKIALCGPHASVFPQQILTEYTYIDAILIGEYEYTLLDFAQHLEEQGDMKSVLGLAYRKDGNVTLNKPRSTIRNLDSLPWPEREDVPLYNYNDAFCNLPTPNVQILSSRGCPFRCIFCLWPQTVYKEHRYRKRTPKDVVDEMEYLITKFHFKAVYFDDDVFNIDRIHVAGVCAEIKTRKVDIPWAVMARADLFDTQILAGLADAGLYAIKYGIESASPRILRACRKKLDLLKTQDMIKVTKELGIKVHLTFCLGLPGETQESIKESIKFISQAQPDSCQFSFATPFPGTEYFKFLYEKGWLENTGWSGYDGSQRCVVRTEALTRGNLESIKEELSNLNALCAKK